MEFIETLEKKKDLVSLTSFISSSAGSVGMETIVWKNGKRALLFTEKISIFWDFLFQNRKRRVAWLKIWWSTHIILFTQYVSGKLGKKLRENKADIRYLVLWLSDNCNLNCKYCYTSLLFKEQIWVLKLPEKQWSCVRIKKF